jgi:hypothetical protein
MVVVPPHCSCRPPCRCRPSSPLLSSLVLVVVLVIHGLCPLPAIGHPSGFCRLCRALLGLSSRLPPRFLTPFLVFLVMSGAPLVAFVSAHCGSGIVLVVLVLPGIVWSRLGALGLLWRWWRWSCHRRHLRRCGGSHGGGGSFASPSPACSLVLLLLLVLLPLRHRPLPLFSSFLSSWWHHSRVSWSCPVALIGCS